MEFHEFLNLIKVKKRTIQSFVFAVFILVMIATFIKPLEYRATTRLLVVQSSEQAADSYTIARSNYYLSNILAQVVYSDSFFHEVQGSDYAIDKNSFSNNYNKRKKQWDDMVDTQALNDTGIIVINTYNKDKNQALLFNEAIADTLKTNHKEYHGMGDKVSIKILDSASVTDWPVKPNIILNILFGIITGLMAGIGFSYIFPEKEINFFKFRRRAGKKRIAAPENMALPETQEEVTGYNIMNMDLFKKKVEEMKEIENNNLPEEIFENPQELKMKENEEITFIGDINNLIK